MAMMMMGGAGASGGGVGPHVVQSGGRFDFDDGGTYIGGWEDGKAHGFGICTGPKGQGQYSGSWNYGFEVCGVYVWPSGSCYEGSWQNGKRHGLGAETQGKWVYRGEWTQGCKGRYGVRQSLTSGAKYEGTWANGLQDGYGSETYADGGTYQGQWLRGYRHGYGVRSSAPFGLAVHGRPSHQAQAINLGSSVSSLQQAVGSSDDPATGRDRKVNDCRGGFVLKSRSDDMPSHQRRRSLVERSADVKRSIIQGFRIKKQYSTGDIDKRGISSLRGSRSNLSSASSESGHSAFTYSHSAGGQGHHTDSNASFVSQDEDITDSNVIETYMGEWKNDKRSGYGIAERSDGLKYEGEWYNNKKYGYGVTTFKDGSREEGKYKNNVLVTSGKKKHLFLLRSAKFRERIEQAVNAAIRASQIALQKADIAISRTATARDRAEQGDIASLEARKNADLAKGVAVQFAPELFNSATSGPLPSWPQATAGASATPAASTTTRGAIAAAGAFGAASLSVPSAHLNTSLAQHQQIGGVSNHLEAGAYLVPGSHPGLNQVPGDLAMAGLGLRGSSAPSTEDPLNNPSLQLPHLGVPASQLDPKMPTQLPQVLQSPGTPLSPPRRQSLYGATLSSSHLQQQQGQQLRHPQGASQLGSAQHQQQIMSSTMPQQLQHQLNQTSLGPQQEDRLGAGQGLPSMISGPQPSQIVNLHQRAQQPYLTDNSMVQQNQLHQTNQGGASDRRGRSQGRGGRSGPESDSGGALNDHFDQYRRSESRPPSRPPSRSHSRMSQSPTRQSSTTKEPQESLSAIYGVKGADEATADTLTQQLGERFQQQPSTSEESSGLGRTASLYIGGGGAGGPRRRPTALVDSATGGSHLSRKKSLPDIAGKQAHKEPLMSREEVSVLSHNRRVEVRRMNELAEMYRANPFLYLTNPEVKDWFSRQQFVMLVIFINLFLAIAFFQLLT
ncbi:uncharacterized protein LOC111247288 [Varroa destructor]|uniref:Junctophilin n=1 Tax=Varroa destructor TaxID=109461 RepID=A0A7M7M6S4_VARDE|nr:uncharacterized protein LOC111247288 [Varroa destructor]XP_022653748.1 uncharacterized protein LOC111247288 [Varroa destructor]XP_022653750.1 uncharacterized protein LOC111247288 [Varroa destructor]XP_022653751.1 uncharacterized protein LOC111247288 [Varroa destructor]